MIIDLLRGDAKTVRAVVDLESSGVPTYCTPVSWAEVFAGIRPGEEDLSVAFFRARGEVVIDSATGRRAGEYLARYSGPNGVQIADALVAASAALAGLRLWTFNHRHYPMPDLEFYEP